MKKFFIISLLFLFCINLVFAATENITINGESFTDGQAAGIFAGLLALGVVLFFIIIFTIFLVSIAIYVLTSLVFVNLAKRLGQDSPGLAWIPTVGPLIIAFKASKMQIWPWYLLIFGFALIFSPIFGLLAILFFLLAFVALMIFEVYSIIWRFKMVKELGKSQDWTVIFVILTIMIPIGALIMLATVAWGKDSERPLEQKAASRKKKL